MRRLAVALAATGLLSTGPVRAANPVLIPAGEYTPVLSPGPLVKTVRVGAFQLDRIPVTNEEFLQFVTEHPQWRRGRAAQLYVDSQYLSHWGTATDLGPGARPDQPVTRVSWYAARAFCQARGARLPTWYEWEYAAAAGAAGPDERQQETWRATILDWYSKPAIESLESTGTRAPNFYGVQDLHGLIWEWVEDFNALMVSGDSRDQGDPDKQAFCGAGAASAEDRENYPMLMRIAFLSSLQARSTARTLGFRCAMDAAP